MKRHETKNFWAKTALFFICCVITSNVYAQQGRRIKYFIR